MPELSENEIQSKIANGSIRAISIDTAVFDKYKCHLDHPMLAKLDQFAASGVDFLLSEVVTKEVAAHIGRDAAETQRAAKIALKEHCDRWQINVDLDKLLTDLQIEVDAKIAASEQVDAYIYRISARVVPISGDIDISAEVFRRYFETKFPFENNKSKKSEFPDAFALLSLEQIAKDKGTQIMCISPDKGWMEFAKGSDYLIVIPDLNLALSWFNEPEKILAERLIAFWKSLSPLESPQEIDSAFEYYLDGLLFEARCQSDLYYEYEHIGASLQYIDHATISAPLVVSSDPENVTLAVKVVAKVGFEASFDFYAHDYADGDNVHVSSASSYIEKDIPFDLTIEVNRQTNVKEIEILEVSVNSGSISVDFGYVDPFPGEDPTHEKY